MNFDERFGVTEQEKEMGRFMARMNLMGFAARRLAEREKKEIEMDGLPCNIICGSPMDEIVKRKEKEENKMRTYKILYLKERTQTEHSFLVDASNLKNAKQAFNDNTGEKLTSIIEIQKYSDCLPVPKVQSV